MLKQNVYPILISCALVLGAVQVTKGQSLKVSYTENSKVDFKLPDSPDPNLKEMIRDAGIQKKELLYSAGSSLYQPVQKETEEGGDHIFIMRIGDDATGSVYKNLVQKEVIKQNEFLGRTFLIKEPLKSISWKLDTEKKNIGNYSCRKATATIDTLNVIAWYCADIPINDGPDIFWGLPGLILEVDVQHGKKTITVNSVSMLNEALAIEVPQKGKEVTQQEFDRIQKEKMEEMHKMHPGGEGERVNIRVTR